MFSIRSVMSQGKEHTITGKDRALAQVALATVDDTVLPCPSASELALLLDGRVAKKRQEDLFHHLASCPTCYEQWRVVAEVQQAIVGKRRLGKVITIGGGLLAAAASVLVFVGTHYSPMTTVVMDEAPAREVPDNLAGFVARQELAVVEPAPIEVQKKSLAQSASRASAPLVQSAAPRRGGVDDGDPFGSLDVDDGTRMLDLNRVIPTVLQKLKKAKAGDVIEVKTYKRDRGFSLEKQDDDTVLVREFGFRDKEHLVPISRVKKTLKTILKTEFPRSNKVWLRVLAVSNN